MRWIPCGVAQTIFLVVSVPRHLRKNKLNLFRLLKCAGTLLMLFDQIVLEGFEFAGFANVYTHLGEEWLWAFALPGFALKIAMVELGQIFYIGPFKEGPETHDETNNVVVSGGAEIMDMIMFSIVIGVLATPEFEALILLCEFLRNCRITREVEKFLKTGDAQKRKMAKTDLQCLVLNWFISVTMPIAFMVFSALSFNSPGGDHLGNVRLQYWHFQAIEDLPEFCQTLGSFACFCFILASIQAIYLKVRMDINVFWVVTHCLSEFGWILASVEFMGLLSLPCLLVALCGFDLSMTFTWVFADFNGEAKDAPAGLYQNRL